MSQTTTTTTIDIFALPSVPLSDRGQLPKCSAVYFILDGANVLYIGKSVNLSQRWLAHHRLKQVEKIACYPRIAWMEVGDSDLLADIERALIQHFEPALNNQVIPTGLKSGAKKRFPIGLAPWHEKRLFWWAHLKKTTKTSLAQNILQSIIEANDAMIEAGLAELAADAGVPLEEYKAQLLKDTSLDTDE
jgi:hypothetical protein